jgi:hypothetical protein
MTPAEHGEVHALLVKAVTDPDWRADVGRLAAEVGRAVGEGCALNPSAAFRIHAAAPPVGAIGPPGPGRVPRHRPPVAGGETAPASDHAGRPL